jgi:hypothetical protein
MSRPSKLTAEATERYVKAIGAGAFPEVAARFAGFSPASLYRYLQGSTPEHAAFRDAALKAQVDLEVRLSGTLVQEAMSEPKWALVVLERRFGERWAARVPADDTPADSRRADRRPPDDVVTLDAALVEVLVPKLLAAGDRLRAGASGGTDDVARFEDRAPRRNGRDEGPSR